jgi:hypothetical protein
LALANGAWLGRPREDWAANPNRDQIRLRFRALAHVARDQPVVVYVASPAAVDAAGGVFLLPADRLGDHPRNRLPLNELLAALHDCPARHRLLILNLIPENEDPLFSPPPGDLSHAIFDTFQGADDPNLLCLVASSPGQIPVASPVLGRTVFAWYLEAGLRGDASGWKDASPNGRVSVEELAAYVRAATGRWVSATRGGTQTPRLIGTAADFTLRALPQMQPEREATTGSDFTYPEWLRTGWQQHEQWLRDGRGEAAPRALLKLQAALLDAERNFLAGQSPSVLQRELDGQISAANQLASVLMAVPTPDPLPTLASIVPGYANPDSALLAELRDAARRFDTRPPALPLAPGEKVAPEPLVPPEFDSFKAKPHLSLALATFLLLSEDPDPTPGRIRALAQLLATQTATPRFAETALIQRLANLAAQSPVVPWSSDRAALVLQTARLLEPCIDTNVSIWAAAALDRVYRLRANAEAVYFAPEYASTVAASNRLREAAAAARRLKEATDRLRNATATWYEAIRSLLGATELIQSGTIPVSVAEQLAERTRKLGDTLVPPTTAFDLDAFAERAQEWDSQSNSVRTALQEFSRPFESAAIAQLLAKSQVPETGTATIVELHVLLATPLLHASERASLWNARIALERRLAEEALRAEATDWEAIRKGLASRPVVNPREAATEPPVDVEQVRQRVRCTSALLRVGGLEESTVTKLASELNGLVADRFAFADRLRRVWLEDLPAQLVGAADSHAARLASIMPLVPASACLDSPATNPVTQLSRQASRTTWAWQAARFEYESRELPLEDSTRSFAIAAARACRAVSGPHTAHDLELSPSNPAKLTPEHPTAALGLKIRAVGGDRQSQVLLSTLTPSDGWIKVGRTAPVSLDPLRQSSVELKLSAGDSPVSFPGALGFLVEAEFGGRTYHLRVPVTLEEITDRLDVLIRTAPDQSPRAAREIRVRPNGIAQPYQLLLANPNYRERKVVARLARLNRETPVVTIPPGKAVLLAFPAPPPLPPGQTIPPTPVEEGLILTSEELVLQLFDPSDRETVRQTIRLPISVIPPTDYLRVADAVFKPAAGSRSNRLSATVVPGDIPPGGPCNVRLGFPNDRNPGLLVRDGSLTAPLARGGPPVSLYADNLALPGVAGTDVWVTIAADGMERAATYSASLPTLGETVRLTPIGTPMVRVKVEPFATGTEPLPVTLEVDNPPPEAALEFLVGTALDDNAAIVPDLTLPIRTAKDVAARVKFDAKGETLLLSGSIKDHAPKLPVELLVGKRVLEVRLLDRAGQRVATHRAKVTFDGTPPRNVHFTDLAPKARKDQPLLVRATCDPIISGIKEVKFFIGQPQKNALPASPAPIVGKLFDERTNEWRATLPVDGQKGIITVGVQFTSLAGLSQIEVQEVELLDPAEFYKPEPGQIAGKLVEGRLPQPALTVFLYDDKGNAKAKTQTKPDGTFEFKDLLPGSYYLFSEKESTNRQIKQEVVVKAGETLPVTLELLLK